MMKCFKTDADRAQILMALYAVHPSHPNPEICSACEILGRVPPEPEPDPLLDGARDWVHCGRCNKYCHDRDSHTRRAEALIEWFRTILFHTDWERVCEVKSAGSSWKGLDRVSRTMSIDNDGPDINARDVLYRKKTL